MPNVAKPPKDFNRTVVALVYDGLCAFEFSCAAEIFGLPRPELGPDWYRFASCSLDGRCISGQYGMSMEVDGGLDLLDRAGTIVIPGWRASDCPVPPALVATLRAAHARGARLLSICSGSFVLAATGLLDGRQATTHWCYAEALQRAYPRIRVDPDVLYVDEGQILTSAGSAAGLDLYLHMVRRDYGAAIANHVARRLVIAPHRSGGQAQFIDAPVAPRQKGSLSPLLETMRARLDAPFRIAELAALAAMSERTFMRRFRAATGVTPADWVCRARVDRARELLESTALPVDLIASHTGLGTGTTMRHHFRRIVGVSPAEYRKRFATHAGAAAPSCA
ncbi:transcriptional regulator FtrA [Robbsia sp. Bb-Pol-6]|uniref:Transcriptional regulator FtrA n=2 Tax=Robbsia betulipollinis TaxID=2981849 RepID=A0ABT3ZIM6_9BURK|nr:transcriptional regulator FtrA [Robbsia betulipollinis]